MKILTDGLIIGEQSVGEKDRLVTVLTRKSGVIRAFVKNCNSLKSAKGAATRLLCYSRLSIYFGRTGTPRQKELKVLGRGCWGCLTASG